MEAAQQHGAPAATAEAIEAAVREHVVKRPRKCGLAVPNARVQKPRRLPPSDGC